ncbi:hypothetical protein PVAND_011354 [Polypedilum vanderplanki]|uniref:Uncharacterized protein n=1 Tax=Polypedilum vanderplanki TaxID=319348 RepID=A0A9J6CIA6_POLVA|nr:hypothetical protein PVAND_011354 [Polypedilum vanderplanki]
MSKYVPNNWNSVPTDKEIWQEIERFKRANNMAAETKLKAGKISMKWLQDRYGKYGKYKQLTEISIFWTGKDQQLALKIEPATIKVLRAKDVCANAERDVEGRANKLDDLSIVYLVEMNDELWKCPIDGCNGMVRAEAWIQHAFKHELYRRTALMNKVRNKQSS